MRIGVLVVAYNAAATLTDVLDRIPDDFRPEIAEVIVCDDCSADATYSVGLGYQQVSGLPLTMVRQPQNLGYGGNQKSGYQIALEKELDIVVLLHGDGQYAPEFLPQMVAPLQRDEADVVLGSRMLTPGAARRGGMPRYKYFGNRVLTKIQNFLLGTSFSEFHSGYRAYRMDAMRSIDFLSSSDGFRFDNQVFLQLHAAGKRIVEIPIPTFYGDEICSVNGPKYALEVLVDNFTYRRASARRRAPAEDGSVTDYELAP